MSAASGNPAKKHRHDVGEPDHGATSTQWVTRVIQFVLGSTIVGTALLVLWTVAAAR
jgi:hypothetical protein